MGGQPRAPGDFINAQMGFHGVILEVRARSKSSTLWTAWKQRKFTLQPSINLTSKQQRFPALINPLKNSITQSQNPVGARREAGVVRDDDKAGAV
ncbi:hypothetical protein AGMMS50256_01410 [Betaproteobacteria bacterium]|nr:hypothetical protein AGMMS50256_01410 [Betaproteobacteria bacterium]